MLNIHSRIVGTIKSSFTFLVFGILLTISSCEDKSYNRSTNSKTENNESVDYNNGGY